MQTIQNVAVLDVLERDQVRAYSAGVLERSSLFPTEGLPGWESEGQRELRLREVEREPHW